MATTKKRINISISKSVSDALTRIAKRDQEPVATKAGALLELALDIEEDIMLGKVAEDRLKNFKGPWISHEKVWGKIKVTK